LAIENSTTIIKLTTTTTTKPQRNQWGYMKNKQTNKKTPGSGTIEFQS
jgi:hypothetical protein